MGTGVYAGTNAVMIIAFEEESPLEKLIGKLTVINAEARRPADRIRLFQLRLERIVMTARAGCVAARPLSVG